MQPLVSIVIPHYNHASALPALLNTILEQSLKDLEVVLVDDCSDAPPDAVVEAYRNKGLAIRLIRSPVRLYTKNARLTGIREALASVIAIADADDVLWDTTALEYHVAKLQAEQADILHFRSVFADEKHRLAAHFTAWAHPLATCLQHAHIFDEYARSGLRGFALWNKLYSKSLWMKFWHTAWESNINIYTEDIYLNSLCMFHAEKYIGSERIGYGWNHTDKRNQDSMLRALHSYIMLQDLIPYFKKNTTRQESVAMFSRHIRHYFCRCAGRWSLASQHPSDSPDSMKGCIAPEIQLKMLILATEINAVTLNVAGACHDA